MEFAVTIAGLDEDETKGRWVLAVDGDSVLVAHEDKTLHWHPLAACKLLRLAPPDVPRPVALVQPQRPELLTPNRVARRALERNGHE